VRMECVAGLVLRGVLIGFTMTARFERSRTKDGEILTSRHDPVWGR